MKNRRADRLKNFDLATQRNNQQAAQRPARSDRGSKREDLYLEMHPSQIGHILQGLGEADAGKFVPDGEAKRRIRRLRPA